jgi:hemerythrin-like domain-containing protein
MTASDTGTGSGATAAGRAMVSTLLDAHAALRRDLDSLGEALRLLVTADPSAIAEVKARVGELSMGQAAWQLRSFCEHYCQTMNAHKSIEEFRIFPAVLGIAPELAPVVERLTADHLRLGELLDVLVAEVAGLPGPESVWNSAREAVRELTALLAAHLDLEEEHVIPQLSRLPAWV